MAKERFINKRFGKEASATLQQITKILAEYNRQGYVLSVRQLYYQLVARDIIPNNVRSYKRIVGIVSDGRLAGLIDWNMIEDRGRETINPPMWRDPAQIVEAAAQQFGIDRWLDQPNHVEVMVEKAALEGVLIPVCRSLGVRFTASRGYCSQSTMYEIGKRLAHEAESKDIYILYLGDHDPSGIDMTRDVKERLEQFSRIRLDVIRLALNMDQVEDWNPPENPAKQTDSRFAGYVTEFGNKSWELDAIEPATLAKIVEDAVGKLVDEDLYGKRVERENQMKEELMSFARNYESGL